MSAAAGAGQVACSAEMGGWKVNSKQIHPIYEKERLIVRRCRRRRYW
jgi:hypothetical protein